MAKLTTTDLTSLANQTSAVNTINANNALVETAVENTLSRDGTSPNEMGADLDMNGNDILNVGQITFSSGSTQLGIVGPDPSVDNSIARWNGITGLVLDDSGWTISDGDVQTAGGTLDMSGNSQTNVLAITMTGGGTLDTNGGSITAGGGLVDTEGGNINYGGGYQIEHSELSPTLSSSSNAAALNLNLGNYFRTTLTESISTITFTNLPVTGQYTSWAWQVTQDAGASGYTLTFPGAVLWAGGTAPTLTATANAVDIITFWTADNGTTIFGSVVGQDFS